VTTSGVRQSAMSHMYAGADLVPRPADCSRETETEITPQLMLAPKLRHCGLFCLVSDDAVCL
jgi:hypothetical protein